MSGEPISTPSPAAAAMPTGTAIVGGPEARGAAASADLAPAAPREQSPLWMGTIGAVTLTVGGAVTVIGTLWPWVASGRRYRNSYDIAQLVERLGFAPDGPMNLALRFWPLVPLLVVVSVVAAWWRRRAFAALVAVVVGLYAVAVGVSVADGPRDGLVRVVDGPQITAVGGGVMLIGATVTLAAAVLRSRRSRPAS